MARHIRGVSKPKTKREVKKPQETEKQGTDWSELIGWPTSPVIVGIDIASPAGDRTVVQHFPNVLDLSIEAYNELVEVDMFGMTERRAIPGHWHEEITFTLALPDAGALNVGDRISVDVYGSVQVFVVMSMMQNAERSGMVTTEVRARRLTVD